MTDRELLEMAARAEGLTTGHPWNSKRMNMSPPVTALVVHRGGELVSTGWDPLSNDGDEACLEAALGLSVNWYEAAVLVGPHACGINTGSAHAEYFDKHNNDKQAARRRAGVRAAAEIGKAMSCE